MRKLCLNAFVSLVNPSLEVVVEGAIIDVLTFHVKEFMDYSHEMPKKEAVCIHIENLNTGKKTVAPKGPAGDKNHVIIALIRNTECLF